MSESDSLHAQTSEASNLHKQRWVWWLLAVIVADCLFFTLTNPTRVNSLILAVGFLLLGLSSYVLVSGFLAILKFYGLAFNSRYRHRLSLVVSLVAVILIALQSVGELTGRDMLVVVPLIILSYAYLSYGRSARRRAQTGQGTQ